MSILNSIKQYLSFLVEGNHNVTGKNMSGTKSNQDLLEEIQEIS